MAGLRRHVATSRPQVYFSACDRQMEAFAGQEEFLRSLVHGLLFLGDLVVPDIFLFISNHVAELCAHQSPGWKLMLAAARRGAIVPAFRADPDGKFTESLRHLRQERIQGIQVEASFIAEELDREVRGPGLTYVLWPDNPVSVGFRSTVERVLLANDVPPNAPRLADFWQDSVSLRGALFENVTPDALGGFRRGELANGLVRCLTGREVRLEDFRSIHDEAPGHPQMQAALRLVKWFNYCYQFNHGRMFGANPSLSAMDALDQEFSQILADRTAPGGGGLLLRQAFAFPSVTELLTISPDALLDSRDSAAGVNYFSALENWQLRPDAHHAEELLAGLERYASAIRELFLRSGRSGLNPEWHLWAHIPTGESRWGRVGSEAAVGLGMELLGRVVSGAGLFSVVGKLAAATFESVPAGWRDRVAPALGIRDRVTIEVEPHVRRVNTVWDDIPAGDAAFQ